MVFCPLSQQRMLVLLTFAWSASCWRFQPFASRYLRRKASSAPVQKQGVVVQNILHRDAVKGGELVRQLRREAAVKCAAFQIPIEPFLHAHHGSNLFLQQVKTIAAPTQTVPWVRDVGVRAVHTVERLRLYGGAGACQSYLQDV